MLFCARICQKKKFKKITSNRKKIPLFVQLLCAAGVRRIDAMAPANNVCAVFVSVIKKKKTKETRIRMTSILHICMYMCIKTICNDNVVGVFL